jgi:hypothetical protein
VGNIMALVDVFLDIVTILEKKSTDAATRFLNWASLGINLIGLIPAPPTMAAARMSLRPTLHLVKQELLHGARNLGGTIVTMLVGHLNASIVGELETFIDGAIARLSGILEDCARLSDSVLDNLIGILQRVLGGQDLFTVARPGAAETNDYDPKTQSTWSGMWRRAVKYSEGTAKRAANYAARKAAAYLPESVRARVNEVIDSLGALKADFRRQLADLANQELQGSIMWLLRQLMSAMAPKQEEAGPTPRSSTSACRRPSRVIPVARTVRFPAHRFPLQASSPSALRPAAKASPMSTSRWLRRCPSPGRAPTAAILALSTRAASAQDGSRPTALAWTSPCRLKVCGPASSA